MNNLLPGARWRMMVRSQWHGPDARNAAPPSGSKGFYRVVCVLLKPGHSELQSGSFSSADAQHGASYVRALIPEYGAGSEQFALKFSIPASGQRIECAGTINPEGCLGKIVVHRTRADSFEAAERLVRDAVAHWLSQLALTFDVPAEVSNIQVTELATGNHSIEVIGPW